MPDYGNVNYWDERYSSQEDKDFDWYQDASVLKTLLLPYLKKGQADFEILIPGCGNSSLGQQLYDEGYVNITNIDISSVVIAQMHDKYIDKSEMEYQKMDARNMQIPDNCFDLIVDKALFDAQLCSIDNISSVNSLLKEMYRVLKPGGVYIIVSHAEPSRRLSYLTRGGFRWSVEYIAVTKQQVNGLAEEGSQKYHYVYTCRKNI